MRSTPVSLLKAREGYGSIASLGEAEWAIDPWPMKAKGLIHTRGRLRRLEALNVW